MSAATVGGANIVVVGDFHSWPGALEESYASAFADLGSTVTRFDLQARVDAYTRLGRLGREFNRFVPIEAWARKANRELTTLVRTTRPDLLMVFARTPVLVGALADTVHSISTRRVLYWPDPLVNLTTGLVQCLPLYDLVASYSRADTIVFERLGAGATIWLPFAADPALHGRLHSVTPDDALQCDVSFVGNWRPERELALATLSSLPAVRLKIWGENGWSRHARDPYVRAAWQGRAMYGDEFTQVAQSSGICLNILDANNYPAANMRLFEIPAAGGLELASPCPEMQPDLKYGEELFYYEQTDDIPRIVQNILNDDALRTRVRAAGQTKVLERHTYRQRAADLLSAL